MEKIERSSCIFADRQRTSSSGKDSRKRKRKRVHIPHSKRPKEFVVERNSKERQRVGEMTKAFENLMSVLPRFGKDKKPSRSEILRETIDYIHTLENNLLRRDNPGIRKGCANSADLEVHMDNQFGTEDSFSNNVLICQETVDDQNVPFPSLEGYQSNPNYFLFKTEPLENYAQASFELMLDCFQSERSAAADTCRYSRQTCGEMVDCKANIEPFPVPEINNDTYSCTDYHDIGVNNGNYETGFIPLSSGQTDPRYNFTESRRCSESVHTCSNKFDISLNKEDFSMCALETNNVDRIPCLNTLKQRGNNSSIPKPNLNHTPLGLSGFHETKMTHTNTRYEHPRHLADISNRVGPYLDRPDSAVAMKGTLIEAKMAVGCQRLSVYDDGKRAVNDVAYTGHEDPVFEREERFYSIL